MVFGVVPAGGMLRSPMRVLFIYPNLYTQMGFNHGLASLSSCLQRAGHETRLVNLNENLAPVPTREDVLALVRDWQPGLVAFSCLSQQYSAGLALARFLRRGAPRADVSLPPLVVGGIHPTMVPAEVMSDGAWDHVGVGECEDALVALAERIAAGERPDDVPNFLSYQIDNLTNRDVLSYDVVDAVIEHVRRQDEPDGPHSVHEVQIRADLIHGGSPDGQWLPDAGLPTELVDGCMKAHTDGCPVDRTKASDEASDVPVGGQLLEQLFRAKLARGIRALRSQILNRAVLVHYACLGTVNARGRREHQPAICLRACFGNASSALTVDMLDLILDIEAARSIGHGR